MTEQTDSTELTKAEQAAWEAPALRSTFIRDDEVEQWAHPCPDWCTGNDGDGHDPERIARGLRREHRSELLRVRQDGAHGYRSVDNEHDGVRAAHLEVFLVAGSRNVDSPTIKMNARYSEFDDKADRRLPARFGIAGLYPDEARELITVLQHLLKVAGA